MHQNIAKMSQTLLTLLIAFCFLSRSYGLTPAEEVTCDDADTCLTLEEAKNAAYEQLNQSVREEMAKLKYIKSSATEIRQQMSETNPQIDALLMREWFKTFDEGNKAFEEAVKNGKKLPVLECIVDCELSARKTFPHISANCRQNVSTTQEYFNKMIVAALDKADAVESKLNQAQDNYVNKIGAATTKIAVNWFRDQGLKEVAAAGRKADKLKEEFIYVEASYERMSADLLEKCKSSFAKVTEDATQCMNRCLQD